MRAPAGGRATGARSEAAAVVSLLVLLAVPRVAHACATCFGGQENDWTGGFLLGTALMLALPPMIVVGAGIAIYRAIKRQEARIRERDEQRARDLVQQGAR